MLRADSKWVSERLKGLGIFLGWIAGLFLVAGLAWFLTRPVRIRILIRNVNNSLRIAKEVRQLDAPFAADKSIPRWKAAKAAQLGSWYSLGNSEDRAVIFSIMVEGLLVPYVVFISPRGDIEYPIPLGAHSAQILDRLAPEVLQIYMDRLAAGEALLREKK
ncbi:MAG: hypothetical protein LBR99_02115 [Treponema sp.]|jgi:hypothetical protein|nr:hypothetical protein [Treponema sp.]